MSQKTPSNKTTKSQRQPNIPITTNPNFILHGQSLPINFDHQSIPSQNQFYPHMASLPYNQPSQSSPILPFNLDDDDLEPSGVPLCNLLTCSFRLSLRGGGSNRQKEVYKKAETIPEK